MNLPEGPFSKALPLAVQVAPVNQFLVEDFNRDGYLDLLCLQNEIDGNPRLPSERAGLSVVCRGLGDGLFSPLNANESGLAIGGQAARASYLTWTDGQDEAKVILAIQESRGPVRLYQQRINAQE